MAWIDDRIWCHPKVVNVSDPAFRVYVNGIAYSTGFTTRGRLTPAQRRLIGCTEDIRHELVTQGLWDESPDVDGIEIHDWKEHNSKRDDRRVADRERKRAQRSKAKADPDSAGVSAGASAGQSTPAARVEGSEGSDGSEGSNQKTDLDPPKQTRVPAIAALVDRSLISGVADPDAAPVTVEPPARLRASGIEVLLEMLPPHEIKPNTRGVLERKFEQLPTHFVELAREELIAANGVRSRVRYLNGIADRMIDEVTGRRQVA